MIKVVLKQQSIVFEPQTALLCGQVTKIDQNCITVKIFNHFNGYLNSRNISKQILEGKLGSFKTKRQSPVEIGSWLQFRSEGFIIKPSFVKFTCVMDDPKLHGLYEELEEDDKIVRSKGH